jgi:hypothetical protein
MESDHDKYRRVQALMDECMAKHCFDRPPHPSPHDPVSYPPQVNNPWGSLQPPIHQPNPIAPCVVPASWYNQHNGNTSTSDNAACYRALADN